MRPPIVGVPLFFIIWSIGPSCLIGPAICFFAKYFIKGFPIKKIIVSEVTTDKPILKVMYLNTFKKEKLSSCNIIEWNPRSFKRTCLE